ncbi:hypothetical protein N7468_000112 [Penicillium chermesinum]|uniref:Zn(2)-C6 fungal-type domain-containing protein n=1 Tax=Penicillium chermesinum TaxID=63820 RepID=A0A9W9U056_9EURO|nr:uncharacterized protein N7468_000112 [Penicillium chermesinum]KAJ5248661.1 hypothetical protein N7468_000112 [Penicillium chermesinum]KAJ6150769.1 hypothetical protein N7470_007363 [Penicillium chermesinum]
MTAVASAPIMSNHDSGTEGAEQSPSRFTAVNGKEPTIPAPAAVNSTLPHPPDAPPSLEPHDPPVKRDVESADDQQSLASSPEVSTYNKHKRKRSESGEQDSRQSSEHEHMTSRPMNFPPGSDALRNSNGAGSGSASDMEPNHPGGRSDQETGPGSSNGPWPEYDSQLVSQAQCAQQMDSSDVQLADALQEAHGQDSSPRNLSASRLTPGPPMQSASSPAYSSERAGTAVQVAPKRKRVFSNRTKTGCMTCRRRKKKCDEQHPACNNCLRGGFLCEGYTSRSTWQKPSGSKAPVPLQSKEGYPEMTAQYVPEAASHHERPLTEHMDSRKMRPIVDENERPASQYNTSPTEGGSNQHPSWSKRGWPGTTSHSPYVSEHLAKPDFREIPSLHELPREGPSKPEYPVVPPIREISHGPPPKSNIPLFQGPPEQRPLPPTTMDASSPQTQARMALSIENQLSTHPVPAEDTERDRMVRGDYYRPFEMQLMEDRDRCKRALWRFNNACSPFSGVSSKEQNRLLKEVLVPPSNSAASSPGTSSPGTRHGPAIGTGAIVEAPFNCHYGYNITIGEDVMISHNCLFVDDCGISIGAHTWIGPNVSILSSMAHSSMQERKGTQSRYQGRRVHIAEDCYLGAGCTIFPGITLYRGAYVAPGEVVKSDIVAYGFQGFKPNYM